MYAQASFEENIFFVFMIIYIKCNRNLTVILYLVFSHLNEFAIWNTQPEGFDLDFYFQVFFGKKPPPSLHVNMIPCPKSSTGDIGHKSGTLGWLLFSKFPIWTTVKPKPFDDSAWGSWRNMSCMTLEYVCVHLSLCSCSFLSSKCIFNPLPSLKVVWKRQPS